jgi:hypothetical protein
VLLPVRPSPSANVTWSIHTLTRRRYGGLYTERNVVISGIHTHSAPGGFLQYTLYDVASLGFVRETFDALVEGIVEVRWNRTDKDFGWESAYGAVSYIDNAANGWALSLVQGPFSVAPCQTLTVRFATSAEHRTSP